MEWTLVQFTQVPNLEVLYLSISATLSKKVSWRSSINAVTCYFANSYHFIVHRLFFVMWYQSHSDVGGTLCERMWHQSQSSKCFCIILFYRQSDRKKHRYRWEMQNISWSSARLIVGLSLAYYTDKKLTNTLCTAWLNTHLKQLNTGIEEWSKQMYSVHHLSLKLAGTLLNASGILIENLCARLEVRLAGQSGQRGPFSSSYLNVWWSAHFTRQ